MAFGDGDLAVADDLGVVASVIGPGSIPMRST
jgi:hypothetical protein